MYIYVAMKYPFISMWKRGTVCSEMKEDFEIQVT